MDVNKWPVGGARLETIGNVVYGMSDVITLRTSLTPIGQVFCAIIELSLRRAFHNLSSVWDQLTLL